MRYAVVIEKAKDNYSAYVPNLPGCIATGFTVEETEQLAAVDRAAAEAQLAAVNRLPAALLRRAFNGEL